jgi:parallel beta-helix repeat protein
MGMVVGLMGLCLIGMGIYLGIVTGSSTLILMLSMMGVVLVFMGYAMFMRAAQEMPFRVYENGVTQPKVGVFKGVKREEVLIPWAAIERVGIYTTPLYTVALKQLRFVHSGGKELIISYEELSDPMEVIRLVAKKVPERMGPEFEIYLGPKEKRRRVTKPIPSETAMIWRPVLPLFMVCFMLIMIGAVVQPGLSSGKYLGIIVIGSVMGPMALILLWMSLWVHLQVEKDIIRQNSKVVPGGIAVANGGLGKVVRKVREFVPFQEVRMFKTKLDHFFMAHEASFVMSDGTEHRVRYDAFEAARALSGFKDEDLDLVNPNPTPVQGKIASWNALGVLMLVALLGIALPVGVLGLGQLMMTGLGAVQDICILVALGVLVPMAVIVMRLTMRRAALGEGMWATDQGLFVPKGPEKFHFVPRAEVYSSQAGKDGFGMYVLVRTARGTIKLPHSCAEKLVAGGYKVDGAEGIVPLPTQGPLWPAPGPVAWQPPSISPVPMTPVPIGTPQLSGPYPVPTRRISGPGALLVQQSDEKLKANQRKMSLIGLLMMVGGVLLTALVIILPTTVLAGWDFLSVLNLLMLPIALGATFAIVGPVIFYFARKMRPVRIHENGIVFPELMQENNEIFIPYGRMTSIMEVPSLYGPIHRVNLKAANQWKMIPANIDGLGTYIEMIRQRVGDPNYDDPDFTHVTEGTGRKIEITLYILALAMGIVFGNLAASILEVARDAPSYIAGTLFFGAPIALLVLGIANYYMNITYRKLSPKKKPETNALVAVLVVLLLLFGVGYAGVNFQPEGPTLWGDVVPPAGTYTNGSYSHLDLNLSENIYVGDGKTLTITDSTITFVMAKNRDLSLYVDKGGELDLRNVTLQSKVGPQIGYNFEIHGRAHIFDSRIMNVFSWVYTKNGDGGLEIYTSDVLIENTTIEHANGNGILVVDASPTIKNSTFRDCLDDAIELNGASPFIIGNRFEFVNWSITMFAGSEPLIENNIFSNDNYGISIVSSSPLIVNNSFQNMRYYAVKVNDDSHPELVGNTFHANGQDQTTGTSHATYFSICGLGFFVAGLAVCMLVMLVVRAKRAQRPEPIPQPTVYYQPPRPPG